MAFGRLFIHFLVPHHSNNHRAKALHIDTLFVYVLVFAFFNLVLRFGHQAAPQVLGYATSIYAEQLLAGTNGKRQAAGLASLSMNGQLSAAAAGKAADMFANNYWAHNSPAGRTPWEFISGAGYAYTVAGENLAKNFSDSNGVVEAWMASPSHRENLLKPAYREVGFAVVNGVLLGEETTLVVQMFGASRTSPVAVVPQIVTPAPAAPVVIPEKAVQIEVPAAIPTVAPVLVQPVNAGTSAVVGVTNRPFIDVTTMSRQAVFIFLGLLLSVLALDAWIVARKNIVRLAGHNIAHILFLGAILIAAITITRGSLL